MDFLELLTIQPSDCYYFLSKFIEKAEDFSLAFSASQKVAKIQFSKSSFASLN